MLVRRRTEFSRPAIIGAFLVAAFVAALPARALQTVHDGAHGLADRSMTAMLWSMVVLVGAAAGLVVIATLWHRRSQAERSGDRSAD